MNVRRPPTLGEAIAAAVRQAEEAKLLPGVERFEMPCPRGPHGGGLVAPANAGDAARTDAAAEAFGVRPCEPTRLAARRRTRAGTEAGFTKAVIDYAHLTGWLAAHFRTTRTQRRDGSIHYQTPVQGDGAGFPDLLLVRGGRVLAAELKMPGRKTTPEQDAWLRAFRTAGVPAYLWVPGDWPEIERVLS